MKPLIVVKVGTGVLTRESDGQLDDPSLADLVKALAALMERGQRCILVSSGAVGAGTSALGLREYPSDVPTRQACAAVGQTRLMHAYQSLFAPYGLDVAQVLLTPEDLESERRVERLNQTFQRLAEVKAIIPIVNENDCVAVEELTFGDNDMLSAKVAAIVSADRLVLFTSVDGLMPPEGGDYIEVVEDVEEVLDFAHGDSGKFSIGGMSSKLQAVKFAVDAGIETVIANGRHPERLAQLSQGEGIGTIFRAKA